MTDTGTYPLNPCKYFMTCTLRENNFTCLYDAGGKYCGKWRELSRKAKA